MLSPLVYEALLGIQTIISRSDANDNMRAIVDGICNSIRNDITYFTVHNVAALQHVGIKSAMSVDDRYTYVGYIATLVNEVI